MMLRPDASELFLRKATQDLDAAHALAGNASIGDALVGFHIQQAIEKSLKAVLAHRGVHFGRIHDIRQLLDLASDSGVVVDSEFESVDEWSPYAVEFRYDDIPEGEKRFDRSQAIGLIQRFVAYARKLCPSPSTDSDTR